MNNDMTVPLLMSMIVLSLPLILAPTLARADWKGLDIAHEAL
jgi:hypothetical protein